MRRTEPRARRTFQTNFQPSRDQVVTVASLIPSPDEADPYQACTTGRRRSALAWFVLFVAGLLEVVWSLGLKFTKGFTQPGPSAVTGVAIVASMVLLARAARTLPIGTAYAVWVGIGAVGAAIGGVVLFDEPISPLRVFFLLLLVVAILGLKLTAPA